MISEVTRRPWVVLVIGLATGLALGLTVPILVRPSGGTPGELVIVSGDEDGRAGSRQILIDLWNQQHPDKRARIEPVSGGADEEHSAMERYAKGEEEVKADILNLDMTSIAEFAAFGYIAEWPADRTPGQLLGELLEKPRASCYYQNRLWALPFNTDVGVMFARRSQLKSAPPTPPLAFTWNDVLDHEPPDKSTTPEWAYAGQLDAYEGLTVNAVEALWAVQKEIGGPAASAPSPLGVPTDPAIWTAAVNRLYGPPGKPRVVDTDSTSYREETTTAQFLNSRIVFMRNWPTAFRTLVEASDQQVTVAAADIVMTPLPGPAVLGGQNLAVVAGSPRGDDARELIAFLASEASQRLLMQVGGFAAATAATYDRPEIKAAHPYAPTIRSALEDSRQRLQTPYYPLFSQEIRTVIGEIRAGAVPSAADLQQRLTDAAAGKLRRR
ncbi:sugar ABC transporter substrate-binding protein [Actinoplanes philippinensis]|uniref:Multiple sugar transport system substrate-binding protein n=1 Tax=Actinoplanes philippinensis TaxID=35752 RepID=A0A1I2G7G6_9ACTN|nr:extracellular solute-binding protein [Actinoplanes philippinensis]GIE76613.1 sugar ABC transporter substrate-binding protein [Actinoplanes philippinensis]SFF12551.1 multiple sugar transport system substrate-binding protein [Actinoplanes philippinensis]